MSKYKHKHVCRYCGHPIMKVTRRIVSEAMPEQFIGDWIHALPPEGDTHRYFQCYFYNTSIKAFATPKEESSAVTR